MPLFHLKLTPTETVALTWLKQHLKETVNGIAYYYYFLTIEAQGLFLPGNEIYVQPASLFKIGTSLACGIALEISDRHLWLGVNQVL